jgi:beta-lactamase superfamily II metal-dependent hydrolase
VIPTRAGGIKGAIANASALIAVCAAVWILVDPRTLVASRGDGRLHVTFLDVGQGDAAFIVFPGGSTLMVDAGGLSASASFDVGDRVVAPVVRDAGFRRIDYLALTHGDPDHIGGALSILREFGPREVWEGIPVPRFEPLTALRLATQAAGARWANVYRGDRVRSTGSRDRAASGSRRLGAAEGETTIRWSPNCAGETSGWCHGRHRQRRRTRRRRGDATRA